MQMLSRLFFDRDDDQLLDIVKDILERRNDSQALRSLLSQYMHPHGIKEMAAERGLRIAYAVASLLGSLESGKARDRLTALASLRDEVLLSSSTFYQKNTARVLVQIMKELLRSRDSRQEQLKLAHDFRMVLTGRPRIVRSELSKYHLLEMPEEWNQFTFDDHVHDANTKGRKSPTHLVTDAWIKGIRQLTVVYYNYVTPEVVDELMEASSILGLQVQVGIEMSARFRDKYIRFIWEPHGFRDKDVLLKFLQDKAVRELMDEGREVSDYQQKYVFDVLEAFNNHHRHQLNEALGVCLGRFDRDDFIRFVGTGQPSLFHLARFIHNDLRPMIKQKIVDALAELRSQNIEEEYREALKSLLSRLQAYHTETIIEAYLLPAHNPTLHDPTCPLESPHLPARLRLGPTALLKKLEALHSSSHFSLNLSNLSLQDILELLYTAEGMFSHIEAYNLKTASSDITSGILPDADEVEGQPPWMGSSAHYHALINDLQQALNEDNVIILKRAIRAIIWDFEAQRLDREKRAMGSDSESREDASCRLELESMRHRKEQLIDILFNLEKFHTFYKKKTLQSRIGSGSTGQAEQQYGMGLSAIETLPARARKVLRSARFGESRLLVPVTVQLTRNIHDRREGPTRPLQQRQRAPLFSFLRSRKRQRWSDWSADTFSVHVGQPGNIVTLGGIGSGSRTGLHGPDLALPDSSERLGNPWKYLNTNVKNSLKVMLGFIPAFLTFFLTKDWWLLAYFGAVIWFAITGSRNIIQSVLGGGGLRRSPLLPWNSLISWSRIADSLLYTGFSVPLLDYIVKTVLLDRMFGVTTATSPITLYAVMGLANGIYISSHNTFRGLPKSAAVGNLFRSIIAIPVAILINSLIGAILIAAGVPDGASILQKWAAIISKFASDCVAAVIEGLADRQANIALRLADYQTKISQLFFVFSRLDLQFPEEDVLEMLESPEMMMQTLDYEARDQEKLIIVNGLDLMYFYMYQPRAHRALQMIHQGMSREEWLIFYRSQLVLKRHREISQVFIDGLVGKNFSRALAFYLDHHTEYLAALESIGHKPAEEKNRETRTAVSA
jgi:hypothetical protein